MIIFGLVFGLFICLLGVLIGKYPNLISGYNTMSPAKKKNVDIKAIAVIHKKTMIIAGATTMVLSSLFTVFKYPVMAVISIIAPLLIGVLIATIVSQRYDYNVRSFLSRWFSTIMMVIITLFIAGVMTYSTCPTKVVISGVKIEFKGSHAIAIPIAEIDSVSLLNTIPRIKMRTNGSALGSNLKGNFRLERLGKCKLFISSQRAPYLYICYRKGENLIYNSKNKAETDSFYRRIVRMRHSK